MKFRLLKISKISIKLIACLTLFIFIMSLSLFTTFADDTYLTWSASETSKTVTVVEGTAVMYHYTPSQTREYAINIPTDVPLGFEVSATNGDNPTHTNWIDEQRNSYEIYNLKAGTEYIITFFYSGPDNRYNGKYTGKVSLIKWDNSLLLPNYPYIKNNEKKSVTVNSDDTAYYLFAPTVSGTYCVGHNTSSLHVALSPLSTKINQEGHYPEEKGNWRTDTQEGVLYHLESGNIYLVCVSARGFSAAKDTFWIRQGGAPKNDYESWKVNTSKTVTLKKDQEIKYFFTPTTSGKYMTLKTAGIQFTISDGEDTIENEVQGSDGTQGYVFNLTAGKEYVVCFREWGSFKSSVTGTYRIEKVGALKSASIYVANFSDNEYILGLDIYPLFSSQDEVKWSISDPSVFSITHAGNGVLDLKILKKGKATITAKVGNISTSIELTAPGKIPVLQEGKELKLTIGGSTAAEFTPKKTGNYKFTVVPNRTMNFSIFYDTDNDPVYSKLDITGKHTFTVNLKAGQKYGLVQLGGRATVKVESTAGAVTPAPNNSSLPSTNNNQPTTSNTTSESTLTESTITQTVTPPASTNTSQSITKTDVETAINNASNNLISFAATEQNNTFKITADALKHAAEKNCAIYFSFPNNLNVELDNSIIKAVSNGASDNISITAKHKELADLNENQQKALDGKDIALLINLDLSVGDNEIHNLSGKAQITIPNPDINKNWSVLYVADDGTVEIMEVTCGDNITFTTEHFSHYALISTDASTNTGGNGWIILVAIILVVIIGSAIAFFVLKKKNLLKNNNQ